MQNHLPRELESEYTQYEHYFDHWNIQIENGKTTFYLIGKWQFDVDGELSGKEIVERMNTFEWIYKNAFADGVKATQGKIKTALGIEH